MRTVGYAANRSGTGVKSSCWLSAPKMKLIESSITKAGGTRLWRFSCTLRACRELNLNLNLARARRASCRCSFPVMTDRGGVAAGPQSPPRPTRWPLFAAVFVLVLFVGSPLAGGVAAALAPGWGVPVWLGGWLLGVLILAGLLVSAAKG